MRNIKHTIEINQYLDKLNLSLTNIDIIRYDNRNKK